MATIVPRWEWRTFGTRFGLAESRFAGLRPGAVQESDELYFLGGHGANVKVRDDLMDIKVLQEVGADGLERWEPVMKKSFPLPAADAAQVFASLHLAAPQLVRDAYTLDQFVGELAMAGSVLRPVRVHKRRLRYTVVGCISELSDLRADGKATRTIAIEAEDAAVVVSAVASVGLAGYLNTNYVQFTFGQGARVEERFSVEVGAARYTERFGLAGAVGPEVLRAVLAAIATDLSRIDGRPRPGALVAMGGAVTNIAAVKHGLTMYDPNIIQRTVLDRAEIEQQIEMYRSRESAQRRSIVGLQPKRAEVILAGACIVRTVMDKLGQGSLVVSDRGLRHGLFAERFGS
jgi:hypothetical protein